MEHELKVVKSHLRGRDKEDGDQREKKREK